MAATLATLRDRVEQILADTGNDIWTTDDIDEAIRRALHEYSKTRPYQQIGTLTLVADGRELDASTLTGILGVREIWCDYTAADPEFPPNRRIFEYWPDSTTIYVTDDYEPQSGDVCRVFYTTMQTLKDLDAATATTFSDADESLIAEGGAGYAATSRAVDLAERVTLDRLTAQQIRAWGMAQLQRFRAGLKRVGEEEAGRTSARVEAGKLDRWEGEWA
jgi:non-ribosomal peptide synthetase component F